MRRLVSGIALGAGAIAVFVALTAVDELLVGPLPFPDNAELVVYGERAQQGHGVPGMSPNVYDAVGQPPMMVSRGLARVPEPVNVRVDERRLLVTARRANDGFLHTLGIETAPGASRGAAAPADTVVVSYDFWKLALHGDRRVLGRRLIVDGRALYVRAVLPRNFHFLATVDLILPLDMSALGDANAANMTAVARLARGVDVRDFSRLVAEAVAARGASMGLDSGNRSWYGAVPIRRTLTDSARRALVSFLACALVLLAVAGMNVSNLMLSRSLGRAHDMAIRRAMGAGRWHSRVPLVRDAASVAGIALLIGLPAGALIVSAMDDEVPDAWRLSALPLSPDWRVCLLTSGTVLLVVALATLAASLPVRVRDLLRERGAVDARSGHLARRARSLMLLLQTMLATGLLALAAASIADAWRLQRIPLGFDSAGAIAIEVRFDVGQFRTLEQVSAMADGLRKEALELAGVKDAAVSTYLPVAPRFVMPYRDASDERVYLQFALMTPGAVRALGLRLLSGRDIDEEDRAGALPVALVNEAYLAAMGGPGVGGVVQPASMTGPNLPLRIVGVVADTRHDGARHPAAPTVFVPLSQAAPATFDYIRQFLPTFVVLRGPGVAPPAGRDFARGLARIAPSMAAGQVTPFQDLASRATEAARRDAWLGALFAIPAVLLAALGLYSVQSVEETTRRRDLALRAALGAQRGDLIGRLLSPASGVATIGIGAGLALAKLTHGGWLDGPTDLAVLLSVAVVMLCVVLVAIAAPACRAMAAQPLRVLRGD